MIEAVSNGWPLYLAAGLFGLLVGSFLNVVILRLPARLMHEWRQQSRELLDLDGADAPRPGAHDGVPDGMTAAQADLAQARDATAVAEAAPPDLVFTGSHCPQCKHALSPLDNIPVLSWAFLRGRCRYCKAPISAQYPLVELLSAAAAFVVVWKFGFSLQSAAGLALSFCLIALSGIDLRTQLLPDNLTLPLLWLGLLLSLPALFVTPHQAILGAAIGYLSLWSVYWLFKFATGKEGMGYGDFKLLGALGAWMGPASLLPTVLVSSLLGAILGSIALTLRGRDRSTPIPFGPFIATAGWIQFIWGETVQRWYAQLLFAP